MVFEFLRGWGIYLYQKPLDFRKQMDSLAVIISSELKREPHDGSLYLFQNRSRDKLKALYWDRNGFVMGYKRLERGRFALPEANDGILKLSMEQLYLLVSGLDFEQLNRQPPNSKRYLY